MIIIFYKYLCTKYCRERINAFRGMDKSIPYNKTFHNYSLYMIIETAPALLFNTIPSVYSFISNLFNV